jgi:hypothetical protein
VARFKILMLYHHGKSLPPTGEEPGHPGVDLGVVAHFPKTKTMKKCAAPAGNHIWVIQSTVSHFND